MSRARERAGLPTIRFHDLRYFHTSVIRQTGLPAAITGQIVGHVDGRTHRGYTRPIEGTEAISRGTLTGAFARPDA